MKKRENSFDKGKKTLQKCVLALHMQECSLVKNLAENCAEMYFWTKLTKISLVWEQEQFAEWM